MADYRSSREVAVSADTAFDFLSDPTNLPHYFPRVTGVDDHGDGTATVRAHIEPEGGEPRDVEGEAWIKVDREARTFSWGADGPHDYNGELELDDRGSDGCTLTVRLRSTNADGDGVRAGLDEAVEAIRTRLEDG